MLVVWSVVAGSADAGWVRSYGPLKARAETVVAMSDGGAAVLSGGMQLALFRTDASGNVVVARKLEQQPWFLIRGPGDSLYLGGTRPQLYAVKLDAKLDVTWAAQYAFPQSPFFEPYTAVATADGGLVIAGTLKEAAFVVRLDADGGIAWGRQLDASGRDTIKDVVETRDGGIVCAGLSRNSPWLAKLSAKGELAWQQVYTAAPRGFQTVVETTDGDLIAAGSNVFIVRTSAEGTTKWQRTLNVKGVQATTLVPITKDTYALSVLAGSKDWQGLLVSFRGDGSQLWQQSLIAAAGEKLMTSSLITTPDLASNATGLFYAPSVVRGENRESVTYLFRIDPDGTTGCPWFVPSSIPFAEVSYPFERLPLEVEPMTFEKQSFEVKATPMSLVASPVACAPASVTATPKAPESTFDRFATIKKQAPEWEALLHAKDFARLESIAAQLRSSRGADPLHWDIGMFYGVMGSPTSMDEASVKAVLGEWIAAQPQSITAKIALAQALRQAAAMRRGGGFANTVTEQDWVVFRKLLNEADRLANQKDLEKDPHYWTLSVNIAHLLGRDPLEVARRAAKYTHNPDVFAHAMLALTPQWGDRVEELRPFAEEAAALTKSSMGDAMYAWIAYQAQFTMGDKAKELGFDWNRTRQGLRDLIRLSPEWVPTYHRLALMARRANDRATAREMFQRKELDWYDDAGTMWPSRMYYDAAREWALGTPAESFVDNAPKPATPTAPVAPPKLKTAPPPPPVIRPKQWPQMVMQNEFVIGEVTQPPVASFLVETPSGVVAVSALPDVRPANSRDALIEYVRARLVSWTMKSPASPKSVLKVQSIDTQNAPPYQRGVALVLAPFKGKLPVHVVKLYPADKPPQLGKRVFVVSCTWSGTTCTQTVTEGKLESADYSLDRKRATYFLTIEKPLDPVATAGGAVLDEDGHAIAVVTGMSSMTTQAGALMDAQDLKNVVSTNAASALP